MISKTVTTTSIGTENSGTVTTATVGMTITTTVTITETAFLTHIADSEHTSDIIQNMICPTITEEAIGTASIEEVINATVGMTITKTATTTETVYLTHTMNSEENSVIIRAMLTAEDIGTTTTKIGTRTTATKDVTATTTAQASETPLKEQLRQ